MSFFSFPVYSFNSAYLLRHSITQTHDSQPDLDITLERPIGSYSHTWYSHQIFIHYFQSLALAEKYPQQSVLGLSKLYCKYRKLKCRLNYWRVEWRWSSYKFPKLAMSTGDSTWPVDYQSANIRSINLILSAKSTATTVVVFFMVIGRCNIWPRLNTTSEWGYIQWAKEVRR